MSIITVTGLGHRYSGEAILEDISFSIESNSKIGLVGENGCGKTTLFEILTKRLLPMNGNLHIAKNCKIAYLTQDPEMPNEQTLFSYIMQSNQQILFLQKQIKEAELKLADKYSDLNMVTLSRLQEQFEALDGYNYENEMKTILSHLQFPEKTWTQKLSLFSGGEKTRIQLAKILLQPYDVLFLDEPTNHLDIEMLLWLEKYLIKLLKPFLIISHDRHFLDKVVTKIFEIKEKRMYQYSGNYSFYKTESIIIHNHLLQQYHRQQKEIKRTEDFIRRNMAGQKVKQAKSRQKMLNKMTIINKPSISLGKKMRIQVNDRSGNDVFRIENGAIGYENSILCEQINFNVFYKDRIALIGKNGCGKTTLLKILNDELSLLKGKLYKGSSLNIGYYDQMHINLNHQLTVFDTVKELVPNETQGYIFTYLAKFGFRGDATQKIVETLSGGEKARLYLGVLLHKKPNLLILDEPTNHLDLLTISSLEAALSDYSGTLIFVSHDLYFIKNISTRRFLFKNNSLKESFVDIDNLFKEDFFSVKSSEKKTKKKNISKSKVKKANPIVLKKLMAEIELKSDKIEGINNKIVTLNEQFLLPEICANQKKIVSIKKEINALQKELELLTNIVYELEDKYLEISCEE